MRGFGFTEHGGAERLGWVEVPEPSPGPGMARIRLRAAAFNRLDRFVLAGIPGVPIERPHVLGSDGAGVVDSVGSGVEALAPGQSVLINPGIPDGSCPACLAGSEELCRDYRILGEHTQGTLTESVVVPARNVYPKPGNLSFGESAAAPLPFLTAWRALRTVADVRPGETVAIIGAGGAVSPAVLQVARNARARVVVLSRSEPKLQKAREWGAEATLTIPPDGRFDRLLWEWSGKRGVDVVFDSAGASTLPWSIRSLARGGRVVVVGATTGPSAEVDLRPLFWRQASIRGSTMSNRREFEAMLSELEAGHLRPVVDSQFPFDRSREAFDRYSGEGAFGKVVVNIV